LLISASVGPVSTNALPCRPSVAHGTSDAGLPERSAVTGWEIPAAVPLSTPPKTELAAPMAARGSTPVARKPRISKTISTASAVAA
jgi:hypothetical protein